MSHNVQHDMKYAACRMRRIGMTPRRVILAACGLAFLDHNFIETGHVYHTLGTCLLLVSASTLAIAFIIFGVDARGRMLVHRTGNLVKDLVTRKCTEAKQQICSTVAEPGTACEFLMALAAESDEKAFRAELESRGLTQDQLDFLRMISHGDLRTHLATLLFADEEEKLTSATNATDTLSVAVSTRPTDQQAHSPAGPSPQAGSSPRRTPGKPTRITESRVPSILVRKDVSQPFL